MTATRSRILYITTRFPYPPDRGDRLHAFHTVRLLASRFEVTLAAFEDASSVASEGTRVFEDWGVRLVTTRLPLPGRLVRLAAALMSSGPLQLAYYDEPAMHGRLEALARSEPPFDALVCHLIRSVPLSRVARAKLRVIALCDSMALGLERRLTRAPLLERPSVWLEAGRVRRYEAEVLDRFDEGWVVSEVDRAAFGEAGRKIVVIPNGVDEALLDGDVPVSPPPVVGFLGNLRVPHNVDAAVFLVRRIMPVLRSRGIEARVRLIGADPAPTVRALAGLPGVEVAGYVQDLGSALQGLRVMCAPLRFSSGLQNKLIEAVAAGVPVVSSPSAVEALGPDAREWIRVGEDPGSYAEAIESLWVCTPEDRERLERAREWVRARFRWEAFADRLGTLVQASADRVERGPRHARNQELPAPRP